MPGKERRIVYQEWWFDLYQKVSESMFWYSRVSEKLLWNFCESSNASHFWVIINLLLNLLFIYLSIYYFYFYIFKIFSIILFFERFLNFFSLIIFIIYQIFLLSGKDRIWVWYDLYCMYMGIRSKSRQQNLESRFSTIQNPDKSKLYRQFRHNVCSIK